MSPKAFNQLYKPTKKEQPELMPEFTKNNETARRVIKLSYSKAIHVNNRKEILKNLFSLT